MEDFVIVLEYCKLFLSHCISFNTDGENQSFAFLIRTEALEIPAKDLFDFE